jgi:hypothetical protein
MNRLAAMLLVAAQGIDGGVVVPALEVKKPPAVPMPSERIEDIKELKQRKDSFGEYVEAFKRKAFEKRSTTRNDRGADSGRPEGRSEGLSWLSGMIATYRQLIKIAQLKNQAAKCESLEQRLFSLLKLSQGKMFDYERKDDERFIKDTNRFVELEKSARSKGIAHVESAIELQNANDSLEHSLLELSREGN